MNRPVISRELLLSAAKDLAYAQGLDKVNIRAVAAKCGVAVGSIYNYFPTKADLIAAVIEDFWQQAVHHPSCTPLSGEPYPLYVGRLYADLSDRLSAFQSGWLSQIAALGTEERQKGRALEAKCFGHIRMQLVHTLEQNPVPRFQGREAELADFTFRYLLALLREGLPDCAFLQEVLEGLL